MNPTHASPADDLAGAHRELLEHLLRLERAADAGPAGDEGELLALLGATRARLDDHFRFEEDDGYMQVVLVRAPQMGRKVDHLRGEHGELRESLASLTREAEAVRAARRRLREGLKEWVGRLRDHEKRENLLVADVFNYDLAAED